MCSRNAPLCDSTLLVHFLLCHTMPSSECRLPPDHCTDFVSIPLLGLFLVFCENHLLILGVCFAYMNCYSADILNSILIFFLHFDFLSAFSCIFPKLLKVSGTADRNGFAWLQHCLLAWRSELQNLWHWKWGMQTYDTDWQVRRADELRPGMSSIVFFQ